MLRSWTAALVATLLLCSPALAQSGKVGVVTKSGGIVVKKVLKNGEIVDEDVKVFGDLDDETRDRILGLVKIRKQGDEKKKTVRMLRKKAEEKAGKKTEKKKEEGCDCCKGRVWFFGPHDLKTHVFSFKPGITLRLDDDDLPFGDEIRKHIEKALEGKKPGALHLHPGAGGLQLRLGLPGLEGLGQRIQKEVEKALKEHGLDVDDFAVPDDLEDHVKIFKGKDLHGLVVPFTGGKHEGGWFALPGKDVDVQGKARIRIDVNGETVLDKEIEAGQEPNRVRAFTSKIRKKKTTSLTPKVKILRAPKAKRAGGSSDDESIRRLERTIERLQRELKQLKRELGTIRPVEVKPSGARSRVL